MAAFAADMVEPAPPPVYQEPAPSFGGWYIRGDLDYHWMDFRGSDYITYGCCTPDPGTNSLGGDLDGAMSLGGGIGYQITNYLRTDLTADYWFKSDFNGSSSDATSVSVDSSSVSTWLLLANAYADLGTYYGFTPYVGAGIGGAHVSWDDLDNTIAGVGTTVHGGADEWRFAWALMAGTAYCLTDNLKLDVGYRFSHINGGSMFELANGAGPGFDDGFNVHEARAGLRYQFGGDTGCGVPPAPYEPEPVTPVYK